MRESNIELLRIVSMVLIIMHHFSVHGTFPFTPDLTFNKVFLQVFALGGKAGVVAFVMITGYFMVSSSFKLHKLGKLVGQIWFYSLAMLGVAMGLDLDTVTPYNVMLAILPFGCMSWFAQTFLVLYIVIPFINRVLHRLKHTYYLILLAALTMIWFVIPTALNLWPNLPHTTFGFKHIFSFIVFYSMGAYIKLYGASIKLCGSYITQKTGIILSIIGILGAFLGDIFVDVLAMTDPTYMKQIFYFTQNDYGFFQLLLGIGLFIVFLKAKITYHPWINTIASTTFGIYLLHDNKLVMHYMWDYIFSTYQYYDSPLLPLYAIFIVAIIFIVGMVVDYMRLAFIEKPIMKRIMLYIESSQLWMEKKVPF